jgi:hypothetical protein
LFGFTVHVNDLPFLNGDTGQLFCRKKKKNKIVLRYKCRLDFIRKIVGKSLEIKEGKSRELRKKRCGKYSPLPVFKELD